MKTVPIASKGRKLNAKWTVEPLQDLDIEHGIDIPAELQEYFAKEIDQEWKKQRGISLRGEETVSITSTCHYPTLNKEDSVWRVIFNLLDGTIHILEVCGVFDRETEELVTIEQARNVWENLIIKHGAQEVI